MQIEVIDEIFFRLSRTESAEADVWLLHAFGESGLSYREVFDSELVAQHNVFVPDLPGFGVTPNADHPLGMEEHAAQLSGLIEKLSTTGHVHLVAHSVSGILATLLAQSLPHLVRSLVSVEGNLTTADSIYSSLPGKHSKEEFYRIYLDNISRHAQQRADFGRYLASVRFASVDALYAWGKSSDKFIHADRPGQAFLALDCAKTYIWGDVDTPPETQAFIHNNKVPNVFMQNCGHWPMLQDPELFYRTVSEFIAQTQAEWVKSSLACGLLQAG